jgi:Cupin domain
VTLGRDDFPVQPGSTIYIPGGTPHRIQTSGSTPLKLLYVFPVDSFSEVEYTMLDRATEYRRRNFPSCESAPAPSPESGLVTHVGDSNDIALADGDSATVVTNLKVRDRR